MTKTGWYVVDNITGARASQNYDTEDKASSLCRALNTDNPGGRYGVKAIAPAVVYALIQEGGASDELYLHVHDTLEEAEADRRDCGDDGAYRTTNPIEFPEGTDWDAVESLVQAIANLDYFG